MAVNRGFPTDAEIGVLEALATQPDVLLTSTHGGPRFRAPLRFVDPRRQYLLLGSSGDEAADAALLAAPRAEFLVEWDEWRIAFAGERPERATHGGSAAIRLRFPESVSINRRRMHERAPVPEEAPLRCVAYSGAAAIFAASVTDMSQGGIGIETDSAGDALHPGMVLAACRIEGQGREAVTVDLEIRHTAATTSPGGRRVVRAGCRFVNPSPAALALVAGYLGRKAATPPA